MPGNVRCVGDKLRPFRCHRLQRPNHRREDEVVDKGRLAMQKRALASESPVENGKMRADIWNRPIDHFAIGLAAPQARQHILHDATPHDRARDVVEERASPLLHACRLDLVLRYDGRTVEHAIDIAADRERLEQHHVAMPHGRDAAERMNGKVPLRLQIVDVLHAVGCEFVGDALLLAGDARGSDPIGNFEADDLEWCHGDFSPTLRFSVAPFFRRSKYVQDHISRTGYPRVKSDGKGEALPCHTRRSTKRGHGRGSSRARTVFSTYAASRAFPSTRSWPRRDSPAAASTTT